MYSILSYIMIYLIIIKYKKSRKIYLKDKILYYHINNDENDNILY